MQCTKMRPSIYFTVLVLILSYSESAAAAEKANKVKPGELVVDHPTLINLGFEWLIEGDDNRTAQVEASYRKHGETPWNQGLPLLGLPGERAYPDQGVSD